MTEEAPQLDFKPTIRERFAAQRFLAFLLVSGLVMSVAAHFGFTLYGLMEPLGHAFFIAALLGLTIEHGIRVRFAKDVAKDVAGALIGYRLPIEVQDHIRNSVTDIALVRRNCRYQYTFAEIPDKSNRVSVLASSEYDTVNYARDAKQYQALLSCEEMDNPEFLSLELDGDRYEGQRLQQLMVRGVPTMPEGLGTRQVLAPRITIKGRVGDEPPSSVHVRWRYRMEMLADGGTDVIATKIHTTDMRVTLELPGDFTAVVTPEDKDRQVGVGTWYYPRLFNPHEHIRIRWFKSQVNTSTGSPKFPG